MIHSACFVFNGDSDGIISQHLMELSGIHPGVKVTGLKRDLALVKRLPELPEADIFGFDLNFGMNREELLRRLSLPGVKVTWFDHHEPGELPVSPQLKTHINTGFGTCTALIVHKHLGLKDLRWPAMACFGDNMPETAEALLRPLGLSGATLNALREGGELINYNAYGESPQDVLFQPDEVARRMVPFQDPVDFLRDSGLIEPLRKQFQSDQAEAGDLQPKEQRPKARLYYLPAQPWARRLGSTFANRTALTFPESALAVLHPLQDGTFQVSIRAPREPKGAGPSASVLSKEFPTGGGRGLAAGINSLPTGSIPKFERRFFEYYA